MEDNDLTFFNELVEFCKYFMKYEFIINNLSGHNIGAYKKYYKDHTLLTFTNVNKENFSKENFLDVVYQLLCKFDQLKAFNDEKMITEHYENIGIILRLLNVCISSSTIISNNKLDNSQINDLNEIKNKFVQHFSQEELLINLQNTQNKPSNVTMTLRNKNDQCNSEINDQSITLNLLKEFILNTVKNELGKNNNSENSNDEIICISENKKMVPSKFKTEISKLINKRLRFQNHREIFACHKKNQTLPNNLHYLSFPRPFLTTNKDFINEFNEIIKESQEKIFSLITKYVDSEIEDCTNEIEILKARLVQEKLYNDDNIDSFVSNLLEIEEVKLKKEFVEKDEKLKRLIMKQKEADYKSCYEVSQNITSSISTNSTPNNTSPHVQFSQKTPASKTNIDVEYSNKKRHQNKRKPLNNSEQNTDDKSNKQPNKTKYSNSKKESTSRRLDFMRTPNKDNYRKRRLPDQEYRDYNYNDNNFNKNTPATRYQENHNQYYNKNPRNNYNQIIDQRDYNPSIKRVYDHPNQHNQYNQPRNAVANSQQIPVRPFQYARPQQNNFRRN